MTYEWDESKAKANFVRHNVDFNSAIDFEWELAIETYDDRFDYGEDRWIAIGIINKKVHVLVYTIREENIRIISLRKANKREREFYERKSKEY
jgi:uncharacterized protein